MINVRVLIRALVLVLLCGRLLCPETAIAGSDAIYMGTVATDSPSQMLKKLTPLGKYLSAFTGMDVVIRPALDLRSAINALGQNRVQVAYLTPAAYIDARSRYQVEPLVMPLRNGSPTFALCVIVRSDSHYHAVPDLAGKSVAFGDERSYLQRAVLEQAGLKMGKLQRFEFLWHHDNVAKAVAHGDFDAGIVKLAVAEQFKKTLGLRIIYVSHPLPSYVIAANARLSKERKDAIRLAFLSLKLNNPDAKAALMSMDPMYTGFVPASDKDFDVARALIAPFQ